MNENPELSLQKSIKSRHQRTLDFFNSLQLEYIQADIRTKIYPRLKDKAFWAKVKSGKKETIDKLADRNRIPSIFTDESMMKDFESKVYRDQSYPLFTYKDEKNKQEQEFYDLKYYYYSGSDVRVSEYGEQKIGRISKEFIPFVHNAVTVSVNGKETQYSISSVTRIL